MSEIKVNSIKGVGASAAAITVNNTDGTCTANITNNLSNRNLIINGAMQVAQRGTSMATGDGFAVDRFKLEINGTNENPTLTQADVASGTTPYTLGFRKSWKVQNGNQTGGAGTTDRIQMQYRFEAQDIANSGWNYTLSSSYITLQFWVKSSVAQNFYGVFQTADGTAQNYPFETGSLTADTWTKVTKTILGNSNLTFDNNNEEGLKLELHMFKGTDYTASGVTLNAWAAYASGTRTPDQTSTWYTTNDATFEITGVQLEVGSVATDFEHRSFAQELALCQRYYFRMNADDGTNTMFGTGWCNASNKAIGIIHFPVKFRTPPSALEQTGTVTDYRVNEYSTNHVCDAVPTFSTCGLDTATVVFSVASISTGRPIFLRAADSSAFLAWSAEL